MATLAVARLGEGVVHRAAMAADGLTLMPALNFSEVQPEAYGPWKWMAQYYPARAAKPVIDFIRALPDDGSPIVIDMGGWCFLPTMLLSHEGNLADICAGLDNGRLVCDHAIARIGPVLERIRRAIGAATARRVHFWFDEEVYCLLDTPVNAEPHPFASIIAAYTGGRTLTTKDRQRLSMQALAGMAQTCVEACGFDRNQVIVAGCCGVETYSGNVAAVQCPINHLWLGGITYGMTTWEQHWQYAEQRMAEIVRTTGGRPTWWHMSPAMPPAEAARGMEIARRYGVAGTILYCDDGIATAVLAPQIAAVSAAMRSVGSVGDSGTG